MAIKESKDVATPGKAKTPKGVTPGKAKKSETKTAALGAPIDDDVDLPAGVSRKEVLAVVERECDDAKAVITQFKQQIADIRAQLSSAQEEVESGARPTSGGVSYLELKLQLLLSYCTHLSFYMLLKAEGMLVKGHPVIEKLVEARTIMEKLRPLDAKLKYQMDKLLKTSVEAPEAAAGDALKFKPNPNALQLPDFGDDGGDAENSASAGKRYCVGIVIVVPSSYCEMLRA